MRRLVKLLVRLYPADWRKRYGVEYEALLDEVAPRARDAVDVLWQALKLQATNWSLVRVVLPCAICGAIATAAMSFAVPPRYISQTVILVTTGDGAAHLSDRGAPNGARPSFLDALSETSRDALNETSLARIIQKLDLYPRERTRMSQENVIDQMRKNIYVRPARKGPGQDVFFLQFSYPDAHVAREVDAELASAMLTSSLRLTTIFPRHETFRVETEASLPLEPSFPKRGLFGAGGLLAGLAGGLMLAAFTRRRRKTEALGG